jgi:hypothetical protein
MKQSLPNAQAIGSAARLKPFSTALEPSIMAVSRIAVAITTQRSIEILLLRAILC